MSLIFLGALYQNYSSESFAKIRNVLCFFFPYWEHSVMKKLHDAQCLHGTIPEKQVVRLRRGKRYLEIIRDTW